MRQVEIRKLRTAKRTVRRPFRLLPFGIVEQHRQFAEGSAIKGKRQRHVVITIGDIDEVILPDVDTMRIADGLAGPRLQKIAVRSKTSTGGALPKKAQLNRQCRMPRATLSSLMETIPAQRVYTASSCDR